MTVRRDQILVVDIEATCWENNQPPPGQQSEIIEIGACLLNVASGELAEKRSILIRPEQSEVSAFCSQLTTLTQAQVDAGIGFAEGCAILEQSYGSRNRLWLSWGDYDRQMFRKQCKARKIRYPFSKKHINFKRLFADLNGKNRVGMTRALEQIGLVLEGTHHRGDDDAWNIARLMRAVLDANGPGILKKHW